MSDKPVYVYPPLSSREHIRILELEPCDQPTDPLRCYIREAHIDLDGCSYEALSYTWGESVFSRSLFIHQGFVMPITSNLSDALHRFRLNRRQRRIWVDAVCINQKDHVEKSTQIPLMARIYRGASGVLVWLGKGKDEEEMIGRINTFGTRVAIKGVVQSDMLGEAAMALNQALQLPWFSRRWIIQEIVLNHRVTMFCGSKKMPWIRLATLVQEISANVEESKAIRSILAVFDLWKRWVLRSSDSGQCGLLRLMDVFDHFGCADDRDHIYALMDLAEDVIPSVANEEEEVRTKQVLHMQPLRLDADYTIPAEQVFTQFAYHLLCIGESLWLLSRAGARLLEGKPPGLASWIPDWGKPLLRRPLWASGSHYVKWGFRMNTAPKTDLPPIPKTTIFWSTTPQHDFSQLNLAECSSMFSTEAHFTPIAVNGISDPFPVDSDDAQDILKWIRRVCGLISGGSRWLPIWMSLRESDIDSLAYILIADGALIHDLKPKIRDRLQSLAASVHYKSKGINPALTHTAGLNSPSRDHSKQSVTFISNGLAYLLQKLFLGSPDTEVDIDPFLDLVRLTMRGRRIFTSNANPYSEKVTRPEEIMGIGPSHLKIGDVVLAPCRNHNSYHYHDCLSKNTFLVRRFMDISNTPGNARDPSQLSTTKYIPTYELVGECFLTTARWRPADCSFMLGSVGRRFDPEGDFMGPLVPVCKRRFQPVAMALC